MTSTISATSRASSTAVLAAVCAATVLVIGFVASINLAAPLLAVSGLHPDASELLWIVDAYVVFFACLVIPAGAAGDRFGRKGVLVAGLMVFAGGAALSAGAPAVAVLLAARCLTGVGAALVLPNGLAVVLHATPPDRRRRAIAVWAAMSGVGGVIGNVGGGALLGTGSWRLLFAVVALIAIGIAAWASVVVRRSPHSARPIDVPGAILLTAGTVALIVGIIEGPHAGWTSSLVLVSFAAAAVLTTAWSVLELRLRHPMLDPRLFRIAPLTAAVLGLGVAFFGNFALFYVNASLLQYSRGFTVQEAGLGILPLSLPLLLIAPQVPKLLHRIGIPAVLAVSFLATGAGLLGLAAAAHRTYLEYAAWLIVVGVGVALALPTLTVEITTSLPRDQAGVGGGLQSAARELGSALGVAVIGTVVAAHLAGKAHPHADATFADAASSGLTAAGIVVLAAGALVTAILHAHTRRSSSRDSEPAPA